MAIRPEKMELSPKPAPDDNGRNSSPGIVKGIAYMGNLSVYLIKLDSGKEVESHRCRTSGAPPNTRSIGTTGSM